MGNTVKTGRAKKEPILKNFSAFEYRIISPVARVPLRRGTALAIVAAMRIRKRPGRKGLLRPDLHLGRIAKELGISHSYLCQLLRGRRKPSFELSFRLAEALGFSSVEELRGWLALYHAQ